MDNILLDDLLTFSALLVLDDVSHTGLVSHEGSKMDWLGWIILGEVSYATSVVLGTSLWQESKGAMSWMFELSVRH